MSLETVDYGGPAVITCDTCGKFRECGSFNSARRFLEVQKEKDPGWRPIAMASGSSIRAPTVLPGGRWGVPNGYAISLFLQCFLGF